MTGAAARLLRPSVLRGIAVAAAVGAVVVVAARSAWLSDDAFFSLEAAANLASGHGLLHNPPERVQGFTNPLWTLLLSLNYLLHPNHFVTTLVLSLALTAGAALLLCRLCRFQLPLVLLGCALLVCSKAAMDYATSGLENPLGHLLLLTFLLQWRRAGLGAAESFRLALLAALLCCTRLDFGLLVLPHIAALAARGSRRHLLALAAGFAPLLLWEAFSLLYYGSLIPNTGWAKLGSAGLERAMLLDRGAQYLLAPLQLDRVTLPAIAAICAAVLLRKPDLQRWPTALGILLYLAYVIWIGGDFMVGRFLSMPLFAAAAMLVRGRLVVRWPAALAVTLALAGLSLSSARSPLRTGAELADHTTLTRYLFADERAMYYQTNGLLARLERGDLSHAELGSDQSCQEVGIVSRGWSSFQWGPECHAVSPFGLTDAMVARMPPKDARQLRPGHVYRKIPAGYIRTLRSGKNQLRDPRAAALMDDLLLATRGPLLAPGRAGAIWRLNLEHRGMRRYDGPLSRFGREEQTVQQSQLATTHDPLRPRRLQQVTRFKHTLVVTLARSSFAPEVEVSLDNNDTYELAFLKDNAAVGVLSLEADFVTQRQRIDRLAVPRSALTNGYDAIRIKRIMGDGISFLCHLRLLERRTQN